METVPNISDSRVVGRVDGSEGEVGDTRQIVGVERHAGCNDAPDCSIFESWSSAHRGRACNATCMEKERRPHPRRCHPQAPLSSGPYWSVSLGQRDGHVSCATEAAAELPPSYGAIPQLTNMFATKGLDLKDLTVLSGTHTPSALRTAHTMPTVSTTSPLSATPTPHSTSTMPPSLGHGAPTTTASSRRWTPAAA